MKKKNKQQESHLNVHYDGPYLCTVLRRPCWVKRWWVRKTQRWRERPYVYIKFLTHNTCIIAYSVWRLRMYMDFYVGLGIRQCFVRECANLLAYVIKIDDEACGYRLNFIYIIGRRRQRQRRHNIRREVVRDLAYKNISNTYVEVDGVIVAL